MHKFMHKRKTSQAWSLREDDPQAIVTPIILRGDEIMRAIAEFLTRHIPLAKGWKYSFKVIDIFKDYFAEHKIPATPSPALLSTAVWLLKRASRGGVGIREDASRTVRRFYVTRNSLVWRLASEGDVEGLVKLLHRYWAA